MIDAMACNHAADCWLQAMAFSFTNHEPFPVFKYVVHI